MANITSMAVRYSGTVTYTNNTQEYLHAQLDDQNNQWSAFQSDSQTTELKLKWYQDSDGAYVTYVRQNVVWYMLGLFTAVLIDTTTVYTDDREVSGMILHVKVDLALDDNTVVSLSSTYDSSIGYIQEGTSDIPTIDNLGTYVDQMELMIAQIADAVLLAPV